MRKMQDKLPPQWMHRLLEKFCEPTLFEGISGDLLEDFQSNVEMKGPRRAQWTYLFQSIGFLRLIFKKKAKRMTPMKSIWLNYLQTTFRSVLKNKAYFAINLLGLILAITCGWFALVYIQDELKFDQGHSEKDQIYRLYKRNYKPNENTDHLTYETSGLMAPTMKDEFPEVEDFTRFCPWFEDAILSFEETNVQTEHFYFADSNFFQFFDYEVIAGDPIRFLTVPSSMAADVTEGKNASDRNVTDRAPEQVGVAFWASRTVDHLLIAVVAPKAGPDRRRNGKVLFNQRGRRQVTVSLLHFGMLCKQTPT